MADLKNVFAKLGYNDIKTIGASGNVLFTAHASESILTKQVESALQSHSCLVAVQIRALKHLRELIASEPFKSVKTSPNTRLYVTFVSAVGRPKSRLRIPCNFPGASMSILSISSTEICSHLNLSDDVGTLI